MQPKRYRILSEASGSLTSAYLINAIRNAGHTSIASDISEMNAGSKLADEFILVPHSSENDLWKSLVSIVKDNDVDIIIPSLDETLLGWSKIKTTLEEFDIKVIISSVETVETCLDKWLTYRFFVENGIPTPATSLINQHRLIKPRFGRGGNGVIIDGGDIEMDSMISQELLVGQEFTVDVLCNRNHNPIYIVPRRRLKVQGGKSIAGQVELDAAIIGWVEKICKLLKFIGPINIQCFKNDNGLIYFTEINPRLSGGMALSFAATENWIPLIVNNLVEQREVFQKTTKDGLRMERYYSEVFIS